VNDRTKPLLRQAAVRGDVTYFPRLIQEDLDQITTAKQFDRDSFGTFRIVDDIVLLSRHERNEALRLARVYLAKDGANVFGDTDCGEGCYAQVVSGAVAFWTLIRHDSGLKDLYLARLKTSIQSFVREEAYYRDLSDETPDPGHLINSCHFRMPDQYGEQTVWAVLAAVRQTNDAELIAAWQQELSNLFGNCPFATEFAKLMLGLKWNPDVKGLDVIETYLIDKLAGRPVDHEALANWSMDQGGSSLPYGLRLILRFHSVDAGSEFYEKLYQAFHNMMSVRYELNRELEKPYRTLQQNRRSTTVDAVFPDTKEDVEQMFEPVRDTVSDRAFRLWSHFQNRHPNFP
jgi:hypothetical protein